MLVLTRRVNQSIMIGDDVVVTVLEVRGDHVRIGITAPRSVAVDREEVLEAKANLSGRAAPKPAAPTKPKAPSPSDGPEVSD